MIKSNQFLLLTIISASLIFTNCGKKVVKGNTDFIGNWSGSDATYNYTVKIDNDSNGEYKKCSGLLSCSETKGTARIKNGVLKIGLKKLNIDREPYQDNTGSWMMELDGVAYEQF